MLSKVSMAADGNNPTIFSDRLRQYFKKSSVMGSRFINVAKRRI